MLTGMIRDEQGENRAEHSEHPEITNIYKSHNLRGVHLPTDHLFVYAFIDKLQATSGTSQHRHPFPDWDLTHSRPVIHSLSHLLPQYPP